MLLTCILAKISAASLLLAGAQTFLIDQMPTLPGAWSPPQNGTYTKEEDSCRDDHPGGCPSDYPFPTHGPPPFKGVICYKSQAEGTAGEGPCGSWCTHSVDIGAGCGRFPEPGVRGGHGIVGWTRDLHQRDDYVGVRRRLRDGDGRESKDGDEDVQEKVHGCRTVVLVLKRAAYVRPDGKRM